METQVLLEKLPCRNSKKKCLPFLLFISLVSVSVASLIITLGGANKPYKNEEWDFLLFTQSYPISNCIEMKRNHIMNSCHFARDKEAWTIHGIWPTKNDTEGPCYCKTLPFNESALEPILPDLKQHWLSVTNKGDTAFWMHEWTKHGTCTIEDPVIDSELTYFKLGLEWNKKWCLKNILEEGGIIPDNNKKYSFSDFHDLIKKSIGFSPYLICFYDQKNNANLIIEIRHCVTKDLKLTDCDQYYSEMECPQSGILYPSTLQL